MPRTTEATVEASDAGSHARLDAPSSSRKTIKRQPRQRRTPEASRVSGAILEAATPDAAPADATPLSSSTANPEAAAPAASKTACLLALLAREEGATIAELCTATGWQPHSVRGAIAGALKKKGHVVLSAKQDGVRCYRIGAAS